MFESKIDKYKKEKGASSSEELFNITTPPDYQCPNIDRIIESLKSINKIIKYADKSYDVDELRDYISDIEYEMIYESDVEDIRRALEEVRYWGQEWKDLAKGLINNNDIDIEDIF